MKPYEKNIKPQGKHENTGKHKKHKKNHNKNIETIAKHCKTLQNFKKN